MGVTVLLICWLVWSAFTLVHGAPVTQPAVGLVLGLGAVAGAFWVSRLMGRLVLRSRQRAGALPSHLVATGIAVLLGVTLLSVTPFSLSPVTDLLRTLLPF
jgi:FtsH-binding integral membrane protein